MAEEILINYHLPFLVIAILIGYQISIHFLYLYYTKKKDNLRLNRILLAYGGIFFFLITTVLIRVIYNYYIEDPALESIFYQLSLITISIAALVFLYCLTEKGFNSIINTKITKSILMLAATIAIILFFIKDSNLRMILAILSLSIASIFIVIFHYKLLSLSSGVIKNRLILITIGNFIMVGGIVLEADEIIYSLPYDAQIMSMILSVPLFVIGEFMIFLAILNFPAFLEFDWKEHVLSLYIIESRSLSILYKYEFVETHEAKQYQELADSLTKGVIGIDKLVSAISSSDKQIEKIVQDDLTLLTSFRDLKPVSILYVLIVNKDMESYPFILSQITNKFEFYFKEILLNLKSIEGHENLVFSGFDLTIKNILK